MAQLSMIARLRAEYADLVKNGWSDVWLVLEGDWTLANLAQFTGDAREALVERLANLSAATA